MIGALVGLLLLALLGDAAFRFLRRARWIAPDSSIEALGLRALLALAAIPWIFVALDLTGIKITRLSLAVIAVALELAAVAMTWGKPAPSGARRTSGAGLEPREQAPQDAASAWNELRRSPAALVLAIVALTLPIMSLIHVTIFPVRVYDSLVGYDAVGKILALEGHYRSTLFTKLVFNAQCVYAPFTASNQGFWYLYWPAAPQLWVAITALGFALCMWSRARRWTGSATAAGLAVFLAFTPPELAFHLSVGQTDLPSMVFVALAVFALAEALHSRGSLAPAALFALLATTVRSENALFALAMAACVLVARKSQWRQAIMIALPAAAFFVFWNLLFVRGLIGYDPGRHFRSTLEFDLGRLGEVLSQAANIIAERGSFGELIWMIALLPVLWVLAALGRRRGWFAGLPDTSVARTGLLVLAVCFVFYLPFFYQWDPKLNPLWTMQHTLKRGYFRFVPGIVLAFVSAPPILALLRRCDGPLDDALAGGKE